MTSAERIRVAAQALLAQHGRKCTTCKCALAHGKAGLGPFAAVEAIAALCHDGLVIAERAMPPETLSVTRWAIGKLAALTMRTAVAR